MKLTTNLLAAAAILTPAFALAEVTVRVSVESLAPTGGVALTPVWVGFHDGSFDSYDGGLTTQPGLEALAEDGGTGGISSDFLAGSTYVQGGVSGVFANAQTTARVDGAIGSTEITGPPPITPGETGADEFTIAIDGSNRYFSYAAMVIPSNDYFVANGNPLAIDLMSLYDGSGTVSFLIGTPNTVNDAGTEAEDYNTSAGNPLFGQPGGQGGPDSPAGSLGLPISNVTASDPFAALNFPGGAPSEFNFNDPSIYSGGGIARITITAIPEPTAGLLAVLAGLAGVVRRR